MYALVVSNESGTWPTVFVSKHSEVSHVVSTRSHRTSSLQPEPPRKRAQIRVTEHVPLLPLPVEACSKPLHFILIAEPRGEVRKGLRVPSAEWLQIIARWHKPALAIRILLSA